jgi:hypothetical protein
MHVAVVVVVDDVAAVVVVADVFAVVALRVMVGGKNAIT